MSGAEKTAPTSFFNAVADAEGDMRRVFDHAYLLHEHFSSIEPITQNMKDALSWAVADLFQAGANLRGHCDALYEAARLPTKAPLANAALPVKRDLSGLSIEGLFALHDALTTVFDVMSGLLCAPRFQGSRKGELTPAGQHLDGIYDAVGDLLSAINDEAKTRRPTTRQERERAFFFIANDYVDGLSDPDAVLKTIAAQVAKLPKVAA